MTKSLVKNVTAAVMRRVVPAATKKVVKVAEKQVEKDVKANLKNLSVTSYDKDQHKIKVEVKENKFDKISLQRHRKALNHLAHKARKQQRHAKKALKKLQKKLAHALSHKTDDVDMLTR